MDHDSWFVILLLLNDHTYVVMRLIFGLKCNEFGDGILFMSRILAKSAGDETTSSHDRGEILLKTYTIIWNFQNKIAKPYTLEVNDLSGVKSSHLSLLGPATVSFSREFFKFSFHFFLIKGEKVDGDDGNCLADETTGGLSLINTQLGHCYANPFDQ